jgi:hypothetical protein
MFKTGDKVVTIHDKVTFTVGHIETDEKDKSLQWIWSTDSPPQEDDHFCNYAYPSSNLLPIALSKLTESYTIHEYNAMLPHIESLTKNQIYSLKRLYWNLATPEFRTKIVENFKIYLESVDFLQRDEVELTNEQLTLIGNAEYDGLKKIECELEPKLLQEAVEHWLRIGDYSLSIGHVQHYIERNYPINQDRFV